MVAISSIYACCTSCCVCPYCASFSCLRNSYSSQSCLFNSCNSFIVSSILFFISMSLCIPPIAFWPLRLYLQSCFLHKWVCFELVALFCLCVVNNISLTFLTWRYANDDGALLDVALCCFANHSTTMSTGSLRREKLWQYLHGSSSAQ